MISSSCLWQPFAFIKRRWLAGNQFFRLHSFWRRRQRGGNGRFADLQEYRESWELWMVCQPFCQSAWRVVEEGKGWVFLSRQSRKQTKKDDADMKTLVQKWFHVQSNKRSSAAPTDCSWSWSAGLNCWSTWCLSSCKNEWRPFDWKVEDWVSLADSQPRPVLLKDV